MPVIELFLLGVVKIFVSKICAVKAVAVTHTVAAHHTGLSIAAAHHAHAAAGVDSVIKGSVNGGFDYGKDKLAYELDLTDKKPTLKSALVKRVAKDGGIGVYEAYDETNSVERGGYKGAVDYGTTSGSRFVTTVAKNVLKESKTDIDLSYPDWVYDLPYGTDGARAIFEQAFDDRVDELFDGTVSCRDCVRSPVVCIGCPSCSKKPVALCIICATCFHFLHLASGHRLSYQIGSTTYYMPYKCNGCDGSIYGERYVCLVCSLDPTSSILCYDLCGKCVKRGHVHEDLLLIKSNGDHYNASCDGCGQLITSAWKHCTTCPVSPGFDLCSDCFRQGRARSLGHGTHTFI